MFAILPAAAVGVTVETLTVSEYADTEVSTNIPFAVDFAAMSRMGFSISLDASPTNCVEAAIGTDTDNDGNLSPEETDYQWRTGWITWEIPFAWAAAEIADEGSSAQLIELFDPQAGARFDISPNGDVTVTKFGNAAKREINATFKLNGVICTPIH